MGLELEALAGRTISPIARIDIWFLPFGCIEFDPCFSNVGTITVGAKYRIAREKRFAAYVGVDGGHMSWSSDVAGAALRARAGTDVRLIRHIDANMDISQLRLYAWSGSDRPQPEHRLFAIALGVRLWL